MAKPDTIRMGEVWPIEKLKPWDQNPRQITPEDFERLKKQITKLGSYKPLIVTPNGIILGGNMRYRALKELGVKEVWVSIVNPQNEAEMLEYALSDNDRAGTYDDQKLAEMATMFPIEVELYKVDLGDPLPLEDLVQRFGPNDNEGGGGGELERCETCGQVIRNKATIEVEGGADA